MILLKYKDTILMENINIENIYELMYDNNLNNEERIEKIITENYRVMSEDDKVDENNEAYCFLKGLCYTDGLFGFEMDFPKAIEYFTKVIKINPNNHHAMIELGDFYFDEPEKAKELYLQAMILGNKWGMHHLAEMYFKGTGVTKDLQKAKELFHQSSVLGNSFSMIELAQIYKSEHKYEDAVQLYIQAISLNNYIAMCDLAEYYIDNKKELIKTYELLTNVIDNKCMNNHKQVVRAHRLLDKLYVFTPETFKLMINQHKKQLLLEKEIFDLKQELEDLKQICYMPGGIISQNCEKHFYDTSEQVENMELE